MLLLLLLIKEIKAENAITFDDGKILFDKIAESIKSKVQVELDFSGITYVTATFLSSSIGQLYNHFESDEIERYFKVKNIREDHNHLLDLVIIRAKEYRTNPESFEQIVNDVIYGD